MRADARVVHEQRDARVFPQLRFDGGERSPVVEVGIDDLDAPLRCVRDAFGETREPVAPAGNENQIVAALCEAFGIDRANARGCAVMSAVP